MTARIVSTACDACGAPATGELNAEPIYCTTCLDDFALADTLCLCGAPLELDGSCSVPECVVLGVDAWMDHLEANADANCTTEAGACWS